MSSEYFDKLDVISKRRYCEKLTVNGSTLPDPLDTTIKQYVFSNSNSKKWPTITFGDIYLYLVERECSYTRERFKNFKSLDSYNYVLSGKVRNLLMHRNEQLKVCVVICDVQASQTASKLHSPWIVAMSNGSILSGHCTCMAG